MQPASRGRGGGGAGRDHKQNNHPYHRVAGRNDMHCVFCGWIIRNGRLQNFGKCPRAECQQVASLVSGYGYENWGRCSRSTCRRFTSRSHCFCEECGQANSEAIASRHRQKMAQLSWNHKQEKNRADTLEKKLAEERAKSQVLSELISKQDTAHFKKLDERDKKEATNDVPEDIDLSQEDFQKIDDIEKASGKIKSTTVGVNAEDMNSSISEEVKDAQLPVEMDVSTEEDLLKDWESI